MSKTAEKLHDDLSALAWMVGSSIHDIQLKESDCAYGTLVDALPVLHRLMTTCWGHEFGQEEKNDLL